MTTLAFPDPIQLPHKTAPVRRIFTCWPSAADLWEADLEPAQAEFGTFLNALAEPSAAGERLELVVLAATAQAEGSERETPVHRKIIVYIWSAPAAADHHLQRADRSASSPAGT
mgnify:CR=1 FL=1